MNNISRGDSVSLNIQGDGSLIINPTYDFQEKPHEISLYIGVNENEKSIIRQIVGCYLNGYNTIKLSSAKNFSVEQQNAIRSVVRSLYLRIFESTSREVILQTFMDESLASLESGVERMHIITGSMGSDMLTCIKEWDSGLAKSVVSLEEDIDQFWYFLTRLVRSAVTKPALSNKLGITIDLSLN